MVITTGSEPSEAAKERLTLLWHPKVDGWLGRNVYCNHVGAALYALG
jgi:hypothetical protein